MSDSVAFRCALAICVTALIFPFVWSRANTPVEIRQRLVVVGADNPDSERDIHELLKSGWTVKEFQRRGDVLFALVQRPAN